MCFIGDVTNNLEADMSYIKYETNIVDYYKVTLKGWPLDVFISSSKINAMKALQTLLAALDPNDSTPPMCKFHTLTDEQFAEYQVMQAAKHGQGDMEEHVHKEHLDKGKICSPYKHRDNVEESGDELGEPGTGKAGKWK